MLCVADRENGRVQCFHPTNCTFHSQYHSPIVGDRLFSVDFAEGKLFVVNGPEIVNQHAVGGYAFDMTDGAVIEKFGSFSNPHDLAVSSDASEVNNLKIQTLKPEKFTK